MSDQTALAPQTGAALAPQDGNKLAFTDKIKTVIRKTVASGIKDDVNFYVFMAYCERQGFDPLKKEIYGYTDRDGKLVMMPGIDGLRRKAREECHILATKHLFAGKDGVWRDFWGEDHPPVACKCQIWVKGAVQPIEQVIYYREFANPSNPNWKNRWLHMLMIRSEAHCLKKLPGAREIADLPFAEDGDPAVVRIQEMPTPALPAAASPVDEAPAPVAEPEEAELVPPAAAPQAAPQSQQAPPPFVSEPPQGTPPPPVTPRTSGQVQPRTRAINLYRALGGDPANEKEILQHIRWILGTPTLARLGAVTPAEWERVAEFLDRERRLPTEEDAALEAEVSTPTLGLEE